MSNAENEQERRNPLDALVVTGDDLERSRIVGELERHDVRCLGVSSLADARASLHDEMSLVIVSTTLAGAGAVPQLVRAARRISPLVECVVVSDAGEAVPRIPGARSMMRPLETEAIAICVKNAQETSAAMRSVTTLLVGRIGLKEAQRVLRAGMSRAALARCAGSRRAAAVLLGVDRRYVQKLCAEKTEAVRAVLSS